MTRAAEQLSPRAATTEPTRSGASAPLEGPCVPTEDPARHRRTLSAGTKTQHGQINN